MCNEELHYFYCSLNVIWVMKGACGLHARKEKCIQNFSKEILETNGPVGKTRHRWEDSIKWLVKK